MRITWGKQSGFEADALVYPMFAEDIGQPGLWSCEFLPDMAKRGETNWFFRRARTNAISCWLV
ncbi:hypothetical protein [Cohnella cholangitidis]|uniref:Uncharacterized protein n=1 Tax=Cohnella cholangitidis TaxID=2598458 RepID=A0A7G5C1E6_9BACL|nr:hypothetical protein [Cohnella cholangitidis]QMV43030.1 hypothetical protein FPL14_18960 [Cohnella cholangitidis]